MYFIIILNHVIQNMRKGFCRLWFNFTYCCKDVIENSDLHFLNLSEIIFAYKHTMSHMLPNLFPQIP